MQVAPGTASARGHHMQQTDLVPWSSLSRGETRRKQSDKSWFQTAMKVIKETKALVEIRGWGHVFDEVQKLLSDKVVLKQDLIEEK